MFSLESPYRSDSNENTQYTIFSTKKKITLNFPKHAAMDFFPKVLKKEFETTRVSEPSGFEPLKFYCSGMCFVITPPLTEIANFIAQIFHTELRAV